MRYITGVGETKLARYGRPFLDRIQAHPLPTVLNNNLSDTVNETLYLHTQGLDAEAIAHQRELTPSTVYGHLAEVVESGLLEMIDVLSLTETEYAEILNAMDLMDIDGDGRLKPVYEALGEAYDYGILRCVAAALGGSGVQRGV